MSLAFYWECIGKQVEQDRARHEKYKMQFKERSPGQHTISDFIGAVLDIAAEADARKFYNGYLEAARHDSGIEGEAAEKLARSNIGWCFGEGMSPERIEMWSRVCGAAHPVFGTKTPSPEEAFAAGLKLGKEHRR
jgi:hypothetical protein